jgi:hypothetical protein
MIQSLPYKLVGQTLWYSSRFALCHSMIDFGELGVPMSDYSHWLQ